VRRIVTVLGGHLRAAGSRAAAVVFAKNTLTSLIDLAGAGLIVTGIALVFVPAAFVAAGVALLAISYAQNRKTSAVRE